MLSLVYINLVGMNADKEYLYEFYFSEEPELAWGVDWDRKPSGICNLSVPQKQVYDEIKMIKTDIILSLAQNNTCFSMQDCKDGIVPLGWEDIDLYEEYPENGRLVFPFGLNITDVELALGKRYLNFL